MERTLNTTDGWEAVVNTLERKERVKQFHEKRKAEKLSRLAATICIQTFLAIVTGIFGLTGALVGWISAPVAFTLAALACFNSGRYCQLRGW